ncbi:MAG: hypothetical protein HY735_34585 [Verrucomicrobia bacterium]|nr:hypothetical protein [Verrucomicrobiota bacterium]
MKRTARLNRILLSLFAVILVAGIALLFPSSWTSLGHRVAFLDGTTMTLRQVTFGTEHYYHGQDLWKRLLALLPRKLAGKLGLRRSQMIVGRPSLVFWFDRRGNGPPNGDPQLVLCDARGFGVSGGHSMMRIGPPGNCVEGWNYDYWPRRERTFTLRIYERGLQYPDARLIGEFTVRNPTPDNYPEWHAAPLPQTASEGDLSVTLFDLTAGVGRGSNKWNPAPNPTVSQTRAGFHVERNGQTTREWGIVSVEASDATGNMITDLWSTSSEPDAEFAELQPHPWPAESAWKLRVGFSQRSSFVTSELWTLRGVSLSGPDATDSALRQTNLEGATLQYTGQARRSGLGGDHHFNFRVTPSRPDYRMTLVKAVDDRGQEAKLETWFDSRSECTFALRAQTNAMSLDLTLALHRTRYVDFLARPEVISTP